MGVAALAYGALRCILNANSDAEVFLLDYGRVPEKHVVRLRDGCVDLPLVNIRFSKRVWLPNNVALLILLAVISRVIPGMRGVILRRNGYLRAIDGADKFVSLAGGDSFSDIYGLPRLLYVALPQVLVILMGRPLVQFPQSIGPFKGRLAKLIAAMILRRSTHVFTREVQSEHAVRQLIGTADRPPIEFCPDVAFTLEATKPDRIEIAGVGPVKSPSTSRIGLNVSGLLWIGGYSGRNMFSLREGYKQTVYALIADLLGRPDTELVLVPHVFGLSDDVETDDAACSEVFATLKSRYAGRLGVIQGRYGPDEIKYIIGQMDMLVGSRMHACIAAISQAVPVVSLAYSSKFSGVMAAVGAGDTVVDLRSESLDEVQRRVNELWSARFERRAALERTIPAVRERIARIIRPAIGTRQDERAIATAQVGRGDDSRTGIERA